MSTADDLMIASYVFLGVGALLVIIWLVNRYMEHPDKRSKKGYKKTLGEMDMGSKPLSSFDTRSGYTFGYTELDN